MFQRPLEHGFDIVVHSVTKYVSGHSDLIGGAAVVRDAPDLIDQLKFLQNATGGVLDPFSSFLALRGLKTLPLRMARHAANALAVAEFWRATTRSRASSIRACVAIRNIIWPPGR